VDGPGAVGSLSPRHAWAACHLASEIQQRICGDRGVFQTRDDSRNNWWVALLQAAKAGTTITMRIQYRQDMAWHWYEVDVNYCGIRLLGLLGLAKRIKILGPDADPQECCTVRRFPMLAERDLLISVYKTFNARDIDSTLAACTLM